MHVLTNTLERLALPDQWVDRPSSLTIGAFDGIHRGHQSLIRQLVESAHAQNHLAGVVTFYPHPATLLSPSTSPLYLTTPGEKNILLESLGLDWTAILPFTHALAATCFQDFVTHLYHQLNMRHLWVGRDFALGYRRQGTVPALQELGRQMGFEVQLADYVQEGMERISSSRIRTMLRHGKVSEAAVLLGRPYSLAGEVVHGAQRGRCIGFPTANVSVPDDRVAPANGVYATWAHLGEQRYASVTNIGVRPSFDHGQRSVETHLLGFSQDIYGCDLLIEFVARLRAERRFADVQDLVAQIGRDAAQTQEILLGTSPIVQSLPDADRAR